MDYEKKYKDLYSRLKKVFNTTKSQEVVDMLYDNFREELYESEDERIRKWIYTCIESLGYPADEDAEKELEEMQPLALAWLEKQKEQKSNIEKLKEISTPADDNWFEIQKRWEKEDEQKPEWSENDKAFLKVAIAICNRYSHKDVADWLKSLRSQCHWKPSEQEIMALRIAIDVLTEERNFPKAAKHLQNVLNAFEGKEYRKDWKPNKEEMDALKNVAYGYYQEGDGFLLHELHEQLKKLM